MPSASSINFLLLVLVAALWASVNARMAGFAAINQRRDVILSGHLDKVPIDMAHRRLIFERDWKPLAWGIVCVSFLFAFIVILIPQLLPQTEQSDEVWLLCVVVSGYHAISGFFTMNHFFSERSYITAFLAGVAAASGSVGDDRGG
jgi:hypothetical protein